MSIFTSIIYQVNRKPLQWSWPRLGLGYCGTPKWIQMTPECLCLICLHLKFWSENHMCLILTPFYIRTWSGRVKSESPHSEVHKFCRHVGQHWHIFRRIINQKENVCFYSQSHQQQSLWSLICFCSSFIYLKSLELLSSSGNHLFKLDSFMFCFV